MNQGQPLSTDIKRQVLYASLLRFSGEAQHLRNRAIDRLVLVALNGTDEDHPLKVGQIQTLVTVGTAVVRTEAIQSSLRRLTDQKQVGETRVRLKKAYYLTDRGKQELAGAESVSGTLLDSVVSRAMREVHPEVHPDKAREVFRTFLCESFALIGLEIAKTITGRIERDDLVRMPQLMRAFDTACAGNHLSSNAMDSLRARCLGFLRSIHPEDERLQLYLTESFFFTQLLGMQDGAPFDPLAEEAFSGAIMFLDTNTVLPLLLHSDPRPLIDELKTIAKQLGIELRVTKATLDEARRVAAERREQLALIIAKAVPDELLHRSTDDFLEAYLERHERTGITLSDFFAPFDRLVDVIQREFGFTFVDATEEELLQEQVDFGTLPETIQEEAFNVRHREKSPKTLNHDVAHLIHVEQRRRTHAKTWFLTRDRSLIQAAAKLAKSGEAPLCFSMTGFLQTLSPFMVASQAEHSLADVFSAMLSDQVGTGSGLYEVEELVVLADLHEDVLATRDDRLVQAIDSVRARALQGQPFRADNAQRAALALKKFLSSSASEREKAGIAERERLKTEVADRDQSLESERSARAQAEGETDVLHRQVETLASQLNSVRGAVQEKDVELKRLSRIVQAQQRQLLRNRAILSVIAGAVIIVWDTEIAGTINASIDDVGPYWTYLERGVRAAGLLLAATPSTFYVRRSNWQPEYQIIALTGLFASIYALLPGVANGWRTLAADPLAWIALIVSILLAGSVRANHDGVK